MLVCDLFARVWVEKTENLVEYNGRFKEENWQWLGEEI